MKLKRVDTTDYASWYLSPDEIELITVIRNAGFDASELTRSWLIKRALEEVKAQHGDKP